MADKHRYDGEVRVRFSVSYDKKLTPEQVKEAIGEVLSADIGIHLFGEKEKAVEVSSSVDDGDIELDDDGFIEDEEPEEEEEEEEGETKA